MQSQSARECTLVKFGEVDVGCSSGKLISIFPFGKCALTPVFSLAGSWSSHI